MKDIKSILIGVFATTCLFLFMGQTSNDSEVGRYQVSTSGVSGTTFITETIIDTKTMEIVSRKKIMLRKIEKLN